MSRFKITIKFATYATIATACAISPSLYSGYMASIKPSGFELAFQDYYNLSRRAVPLHEFEESVLKMYNIAGSFKKEIIWEAVNKSGAVKEPNMAYKAAMATIEQSKANNTDGELFDAKYLRKNLFKDLTQKEAKDLSLYLIQRSSFGREVGIERNELKKESIHEKLTSEYLANAKKLGLIDSINPHQSNYDIEWVAGASRAGVMARLIYSSQIKAYVNIKYGTEILAGQRPIWAEIDGMMPELKNALMTIFYNKTPIDKMNATLTVGDDALRTTEGKEYILKLAESTHIRLDPDNPFIFYKSKEECPKGFFPGRHYPNYAKDETRRLTESTMSEDLAQMLNFDTNIIDTKKSNNHERPTTATTAADATQKFVTAIKEGKYGDQKEFIVLLDTNNPYIERQALKTQIEVDKILKESGLSTLGYKIKIEGVGFFSKQDYPVIKSEFAVLVATWYEATEGADSIKPLLYQSMDKSEIAPAPDVVELGFTLSGYFQHFFDEWLE